MKSKMGRPRKAIAHRFSTVLSVRITKSLDAALREKAKQQGYKNLNAFIRKALNDLVKPSEKGEE